MAAPRRLASGLSLILGVLCACTPGTAATTTTTPPATTTTTEISTSTAPATTTTAPAEQTVQVLLQPLGELGPEWTEIFLPYGEAEHELGTSPGGEGLMLGPEYGTQTPDGKWWILDAAKQRAAVFSRDGEFEEAIDFPEEVLVDGQYFQYQMPQALDDGSIAAGGFRGEDTTALLRIVDGEVTSTSFEGSIPWVTTDGTHLYGLTFEDAAPHRLDPASPEPEPVDALVTRAGSPFTASVQGDELVVALPDIGVTRTLQLRYSEDPEVIANAGIEVETGVDGSIFILMIGAPESDESLGIGGFLRISPEGVVGEVEPVSDPFSPADPGTPARLGVTPGTTAPWLMMVDEDGVRVYTRPDMA